MNDWILRFSGYDPADERRREALCTVGNGYFATRGAWAGASPDDRHYPGTYLAGCYNRLTDDIDHRTVENESLVNLPDWLPLTVAIENGDWLSPDTSEVLEYDQELNLRSGLLARRFLLRDPLGRQVRGVERRFVSMAEPHLAGQTLAVTAVNWSGRLRIGTSVRGDVTNSGVERYRKLSGRHLTDLQIMVANGNPLVAATTSQSRHRVAVGTRTVATHNGVPAGVDWTTRTDENSAYAELAVPVVPGDVVAAEKVAAIYGSHDVGISEPLLAARTALDSAAGFDALRDAHALAWSQLWRRFSLDLEEPFDGTLASVRLNIFHLLQSVSPHSVDADAGVPARGLHGEAYRGHVFWDELFVFPVLTLRMPELTRALLLYRYRRLPAARLAARQDGCRVPCIPGSRAATAARRASGSISTRCPGAGPRMRPSGSGTSAWRSPTRCGSTSRPPGTWSSSAITAPKCSSRSPGSSPGLAEYDPGRDRYVIRGVVGPDEFHTSYPDRLDPGIDNNAYTNVMAVWLFGVARRGAGAAAGLATDRAHRVARPPPGRTQPLGRADPPDVRAVPRRRDQPVRGIRAAGRARLAPLPRQVRRHPATGPDPRGRGTGRDGVPGVQAGRRADAAVPAAAPGVARA